MSDPISNLRIHFYGVQGSGSVFPSRAERQALYELNDYELLTRVFDDLERHLDGEGMLRCSVEQLINEPRSKKALLAYRNRMGLPEPRVYGGWTTCVRVETADGHDLWALVLEASRLDEVTEQAVRTLEFSVLAKYAFGLAQLFNAFYHRYPILNEEQMAARRWRAAAGSRGCAGGRRSCRAGCPRPWVTAP